MPYILGIGGSVAVGKSTTARVLRALLARWPDHPRVDLITTDGFLYSNAELKRRDANAADPTRSLGSLQAHDARIALERSQLAVPVLATIDKLWKDLDNDLNAIATEEQYKRHGRLRIGHVGRRPFDSVFMDGWVPYFDMAVGACLILGLFTRPAALAGGLFLLSVCLSQWPLAAGAAAIYYQAVEMLALFALAAIGAGQYAGLDFLLGGLYRMCCGRKPAATSRSAAANQGAKR